MALFTVQIAQDKDIPVGKQNCGKRELGHRNGVGRRRVGDKDARLLHNWLAPGAKLDRYTKANDPDDKTP